MRRPLSSLIFTLSLLVLVMAFWVVPSASAQVAQKHKNVLFLSSDDPHLLPQVIVEQALRSTLKSGSAAPVEIYTEYLDSVRTPFDSYEKEFINLLRRKYQGRKFDLIIAISTSALRTLMTNRSDLFPDVPVVFVALDRQVLETLSIGPDVTGVWGQMNFKSNLDLALKLHPNTRKVVVVGGVSNLDKYWTNRVRQDFSLYEGQLEIGYLIGLTVSDLKKALESLSPNTIVVFVSSTRDNTGNSYANPDVLRQISPSSAAPIYGVTDAQLGMGIVGGSIIGFEVIGAETGSLGLRILAGEKPQAIAPYGVPNAIMFDYRELRRWNVDESLLPAESVVRFREPSFWQLYRWRIIGAISLIILQTLLIIGLLLNRAKRRSAEAATKASEEDLRQSEARFRHMADTAPVLIWISDTEMLCTYFNQKCLDFTGRTMEELLGEGWLEILHEDDISKCVAAYTAGYERNEPFVLEYRILNSNGDYRWLYSTGAPRFASNGDFLGYIGSAVDMTDRKSAEEALQVAHEEVSKLKNQLEAENVYLQEEIKLAHNVTEIVGESDAIKYVLYKIEQVSQTDSTVLILGETGTGKELVARAIHNQSTRKDRPLVKVNCATLSASLIESELFGHEKGAFTGASARKIGRFELADGATLFLDEIGELPLELQAKLLRVVQEGEFERLGSTKTMKVDVRILAATNRNLKVEVEKGAFREDLWYRLNVFPLTVPPLRQRKEDIPLIVEHFVGGYSRKVGKIITSISSSTIKKLKDYSWPGNVRELANVIERAMVNAQGPILHIADQFEQPHPEKELDLTRTLEDIEKEYIVRILDRTRWRIGGANGAATVLGLNPSTLRTRMLKLGIQKSVSTASTSS